MHYEPPYIKTLSTPTMVWNVRLVMLSIIGHW
jgi:hypothetical protein